ncbi:MAG: protein kinase [Bacteroidota bacterium]
MARAEDTANERPPARAQDRRTTAPGSDHEQATPPNDAGPSEAPPEPARIGYIGKRLGRFHITAELGRGGMATVYRARDPQVGRDVAVKVMHGFFAGRVDIEARFRREANAVAAIRHPSILALYDFAPPAGEEPGYIVSELIEGPGLRQIVDTRSGRLLPEIAANITVRVAEALGAAHAAGIVHRDVKPDNVLIDTSAGRVRVVLTDFGVAHVSGMDTMTATGAVLGSPAYMSPEQARGEDVGPPSDVFSLGVMLYQLCTGHLPFAGKDPLAVIAAILRGEYLRPAKLEARVGPDLERVITRCLHRDPATRFPDGTAVAAALRAASAAVLPPELTDDDVTLGRYLTDPVGFEREASPAIARAALAAADGARRARQLPRAIAEIGRALAYAPDDPAANEMLARLGAGRRSRAAIFVAAGAAVAVLAGAAFFLLPARRGLAPAVAPAEGTRAGTTPAARAPSSPPAGVVARPAAPPVTRAASGRQPEGVAPPPERTAGSTPGDSMSHRRRRASRGDNTTTAAATPSSRGTTASGSPLAAIPAAAATPTLAPAPAPAGGAATTAAGEATPPGTNATAPPALAAPTPSMPTAPAATGRIVVRASHGFCEPSVDAHPPSLRANHDDLAPGPHEIFCTLPQGGGKVHVATYDLRPGTRPSLIVVRGPDGRPVLGRTE